MKKRKDDREERVDAAKSGRSEAFEDGRAWVMAMDSSDARVRRARQRTKGSFL